MRALYAAFGRILPEDLVALRADVIALSGFNGLVFLDSEDGVDPGFLAAQVRQLRPDLRLVLPLVGRDRNRTALAGAARTALALGADGLLLLSGRLDPANPARTVYDLDPAQMIGFLKENGIGVEFWVSSRCSTEAEQARVRNLQRLGASRCVVPWTSEDPVEAEASFQPIFLVREADWGMGRLPAGGADTILRIAPGRGEAAARRVARGGKP